MNVAHYRRLGLIDFGFVVPLDEDLWELFARMDRPLTTGRREDLVAAIKEWSGITDAPADADQLRLQVEYAHCCWYPRYCGGEFDFGDDADFRRSVDIFTEMVGKRYSRGRPTSPTMARQQFGVRSILYRLKAKIDVRSICEQEVKAAGWDRSDYA